MTDTTGISITGKISTAVLKMANAPATKINMDITTNVYGLFKASLTIHIMVMKGIVVEEAI
jgi:hypothetical protein